MITLCPYPEYKPSGVDWLGEIPSHWATRKLKTLARMKSGEGITSFGIEGEGTFPVYGGNGVRGYSESFTHSGDFLLVGRQGALCGNVHRVSGTFWASEHAIVVTPQNDADVDWLGRVLAGMNLNQYSISAAQPGLAVERIIQLAVPYPSLDEQRAIAAFLEAMDERVTRFIAARRRMIALLEEQKQATINQAVTRGLDPDVPMRPSGIDWLGDIPAHWDVTRIRSIATFVTSGSRDWAAYYADTGPAFIRIGNLSTTSVDMKLEHIQRVQPPAGGEGARTSIEQGDVLLSITAQMGAVGIIPSSLGEAYINQHTALIRINRLKAFPRWVAYSLLSQLGKHQCEMLTNGGTKQGLGLDDVRSIFVLLPSCEEQERIIDKIDYAFVEANAAMARFQREIELIQEYQTRLISDVVTGKLDVRGVVPDELADSEADQPTEN